MPYGPFYRGTKEYLARSQEWRLQELLGKDYQTIKAVDHALDYLEKAAKRGWRDEDDLLLEDVKDVISIYHQKYRPDQARVPAGNAEGGQWTSEGGGGIGGGSGGAATDGARNHKPFPSAGRVADSGRVLSDGRTGAVLNVNKTIRIAEKNIVDSEKYPFGNRQCAEKVSRTLEESTGKTFKRPASKEAKDYGDAIKTIGFEPLFPAPKGADYPPHGRGDLYKPEPGDVIVIQGTSKSPEGHMAIYAGKKDGKEVWISDFVQKRGPYPGAAYRDEKPSYVIYRATNRE